MPSVPPDSAAPLTRREFVTTAATIAGAWMIVPRHVLGRGLTPPSDLVNESYMPYSIGGAFPAGWYRIEIERHEVGGVDTYMYAVRRWTGSTFDLIVPADGSSNPRSFPASALSRHDDAPLGPGYVGVFVAFFDPARVAAKAHVDWDHIEADW